jgi:hypothetical protein
MYDYPGDTNGLLEFVEIYNPAPTNRPLDHWQLLKGINFAFPNGILLPATGTVVLVNFDPQTDPTALANFRATYNIGTEVPLYGPFSGRLDNNGETLRLSSPDAPPTDDPTFYPALIEDETRYAITPPWPQTPAGTGDSLNRLNPEQWGYDPLGWYASAPTPGTYQPTPLEGFVQWQRNAFPYETPAEDRSWNADPDTNGFPNGYAYAFGFNPLSGLPPEKIITHLQPAPANTLDMTYRRRINATDLVYRVLLSGDLDRWTDAGTNATLIDLTPLPDGTNEQATLRIQLSAPAFSNECGYLRISADPNP